MFVWDRRQARISLLLFLFLFAVGQGIAFLQRPVNPDPRIFSEPWPPEGCLLDATAVSKALVAFPEGTSVSQSLSGLALKANAAGSGFALPRAGVLVREKGGWSVRSMTQKERWIWRLPMDVHRCTPEDFSRIRGIGTSLGEKIHRFVQEKKSLDSLEDLLAVPGIASSRLRWLEAELSLE